MLPFVNGGNPFGASPQQALAQSAQQAKPEPSVAGQISSTLGDAFSGRGIFGGSPDDGEIDPATGAPKGMARQAGMQSMMKMGLLFLAAGQNMSADSRAAILSRAPALVGDSGDSINSFAKNRLEMAKLKLEERKQMQEAAAGREQTAALRALTGQAPLPSEGAQAVAGTQAGNAGVAQAVGAPEAAAAAPQAPAMPLATPTGPALAPGGVPRGRPLLSPADAAGVLANPTIGGRGQALNQSIIAAQGRETQGAPTFNPVTNKIETPIYNGRGELVRTTVGDTPAMTTRDVEGMREKGYKLPNGGFHVVDRTEIRDPTQERNDKAFIDIASKDRDTLQSVYQEKVQTAVKNYDKMKEIRAQVSEGKGIFGTGSDYMRSAIRVMATMDPGKKELAEYLNVPANFERILKSGVAGVIQDFNGSTAVSDADRKFAQEVMQAAATKSRPEIINALNNAMQDQRNLISKHNENAERHNSGLTGLDDRLTGRLKVTTVDRDFDKEEAEAAKVKPEKPPTEGVVKWTRDPKTGLPIRVVQ